MVSTALAERRDMHVTQPRPRRPGRERAACRLTAKRGGESRLTGGAVGPSLRNQSEAGDWAEDAERSRLRCEKELAYLASLHFSHPRFQDGEKQAGDAAEDDDDAADLALSSEAGDDKADKNKEKEEKEDKEEGEKKKKYKKRKPRYKK